MSTIDLLEFDITKDFSWSKRFIFKHKTANWKDNKYGCFELGLLQDWGFSVESYNDNSLSAFTPITFKFVTPKLYITEVM